LLCKPANGAAKSLTDAQGNDSAQKHAQGNTQHASEGTNPNKPLSASSAARILRNTPAKTASIAQRNVTERHVAKNALSVRSVANVCPKCATHIARAVVQAKTKTERSTPTLEYIEGRRRQILNQSLALIAESQESTDTILTTPTLKMWYGYVQRAIENDTKKASRKTSGKSETSRFLYTAKASKSDRNAGLPPGEENDHPTVKPTDLIGWLLRLVEMPERNLILDPFAGSGTTPYVCQQMGLPCIAIDQDEESCELAAKRLSEPSLFS